MRMESRVGLNERRRSTIVLSLEGFLRIDSACSWSLSLLPSEEEMRTVTKGKWACCDVLAEAVDNVVK